MRLAQRKAKVEHGLQSSIKKYRGGDDRGRVDDPT